MRKSPIAGTWYPGEKQTLLRQIEDYFAQAKPSEVLGRIFAVISLAQLPGDALAFLGTQVDVIFDVPSFLIRKALECFHRLGRPFHK
ncbi:MAG: hypothetical protein NTZ51_09410, partial [Proteobacteria bacterium]|nr:hypothetical protein [Pseudomonadota bacterium]